MTAAKQKRGIEALLFEVIKRVPPPRNADKTKPFRGLVIDSWVERNEKTGIERILALTRIAEGSVKKKDILATLNGKAKLQVNEVGLLYPDPIPVGDLIAGQVGYIELEYLGSSESAQQQQQQ